MNATLPVHLFFQERINHSVSRWLHFGLESLRNNVKREVGLPRSVSNHSLMVRV